MVTMFILFFAPIIALLSIVALVRLEQHRRHSTFHVEDTHIGMIDNQE